MIKISILITTLAIFFLYGCGGASYVTPTPQRVSKPSVHPDINPDSTVHPGACTLVLTAIESNLSYLKNNVTSCNESPGNHNMACLNASSIIHEKRVVNDVYRDCKKNGVILARNQEGEEWLRLVAMHEKNLRKI